MLLVCSRASIHIGAGLTKRCNEPYLEHWRLSSTLKKSLGDGHANFHRIYKFWGASGLTTGADSCLEEYRPFEKSDDGAMEDFDWDEDNSRDALVQETLDLILDKVSDLQSKTIENHASQRKLGLINLGMVYEFGYVFI